VKVNTTAAKDGLVGLANSATIDEKAKELASRLATQVAVHDLPFAD
jgi:PleD family two-component response regulator